MSGHYYLNGVLVPAGTEGALPSVTTILDVRAKPGLDAWRRRVGEEAADKKMVEAQDLGTWVHQAVERYLNGGSLYEDDDTVNQLASGFASWQRKVSPDRELAETFVTSSHGYAGTIDLICEIDGETWIIDFKTGKIKPEHGLQLAAYAEAWAEHNGWVIPRRAVLQLTPEIKRGWRFKEFDDFNDFNVFLAHKEIYDYNCKNNPLKLPTKWDGGVILAT